ncbi:hypothetical protein [Dyadobacter luticola]|uniref:Uncharacterized protein n=1 Tax=Dyadobacter luticola TaxID=1979387 RepID=A0A5R9L494_9BACT|nr:hypothetical protein [Dyadobacter luticola]TLV03404.1 hypothetical protein FEN17_07305 [Dyadobacter luticola]
MKSRQLLLLILVTAGCVTIPEFGDAPAIYYNGISQSTEVDASGKKIKERVTVMIDFEDGDGDLGASPEEYSDPVFRARYGNRGNYELVTVTRALDGTWSERIADVDSAKWMPLLKPTKTKGPIKGKLDFNAYWPYGNSTQPIEIKYKVRIRDRALNVSNQIETDVITVPGYR